MRKVLHPADWAPAKGYANGIAARGTQIYVGGQIGWNAQQQFESDDFIAQTRQALINIMAVLKAGHAGDAAMVKALQDHVKATIAPFKYPREIEFVNQLPRTETGKLQRFRLRQA